MVGVKSREVVLNAGNIHCITREQPRPASCYPYLKLLCQVLSFSFLQLLRDAAR